MAEGSLLWIAAAVVALLAVGAAHGALRFARVLGAAPADRTLGAPLAVLSVLFAACCAGACLFPVLPIALYIALWLSCAGVLWLLVGHSRRSLLAANLASACLAGSNLLISAGAASLRGLMLWQFNEDAALRTVSLAASLVLFMLVAFAVERLLAKTPLPAGDRPSVQALSLFGWFSMLYVLFDALPNAFRLDIPLQTPFVAVSTLLLACLSTTFIVSTIRLARDSYLEEDYLALVERRERERERISELRALAYTDALTGLTTRRRAIEAVERLAASGAAFALVYLDLNDLKRINDAGGHECGDACLTRLAEVLRAVFGGRGEICRMSGDEFLVVLEGLSEDEARRLVEAAKERLGRKPVEGAGVLSFSYGIASAQVRPASDPSEVAPLVRDLLASADRRMYEDKRLFHGAAAEGVRPR